MKTVGFIISTKENEKRRALLPYQIKEIKHKSNLFFEEGYGEELGFSDLDYIGEGANVVTRSEVLKKDIICDPKIGDATYLSKLKNKQMIFGYIHAVQNKSITDLIIKNSLTAIAWEDMYQDGRHVFWRNNELAGEAAILHAFTLYGKLPNQCKVALIGKGNTSRGAYRVLTSLGAEVVVYDRKTENLLRNEIKDYDVIVNGVLWDPNRNDHIIYNDDLIDMKKNSMIIDISCDKEGGIQSSIPTTIENPTYTKNSVLHYVVDHTPSLLFLSVSESFGQIVLKYIDFLVENKIKNSRTLTDALIIEEGKIIDNRIKDFQDR